MLMGDLAEPGSVEPSAELSRRHSGVLRLYPSQPGRVSTGLYSSHAPIRFRTWLDGFFLTGLLVLYNPRGRSRLREGTTYGREPVEVWMSRSQLDLRYSEKPEDGDIVEI